MKRNSVETFLIVPYFVHANDKIVYEWINRALLKYFIYLNAGG